MRPHLAGMHAVHSQTSGVTLYSIYAPRRPILRTLLTRRGVIIGTTEDDGFCTVEAEVPLGEMFGYSTEVRSATQGKAEFTMEFARYGVVPRDVAEGLKKKYADRTRSAASE